MSCVSLGALLSIPHTAKPVGVTKPEQFRNQQEETEKTESLAEFREVFQMTVAFTEQ
jgi:hypothetical protein